MRTQKQERRFPVVAMAVFAGLFSPVPADAGVNQWTSGGPFQGLVATIAMDPVDSLVLYAGGADSLPSDRGVFKSIDGGASWRLMGLGDQRIRAVAAASPRIAYAGGDLFQSGALFKSIDGGATWTQLRLEPNLVNWAVFFIRIDPTNPETVYVGTTATAGTIGLPGELHRSNDGGATWSQISAPLGGGRVRGFAIEPRSPNTLFAVTEQFFKSSDFGSSCTRMPNALEHVGSVSQLAVDARASGTIYASTSQGVLKSTDGGLSFVPSSTGLPSGGTGVLLIDPGSEGTLYVGTSQNGVFRTRDGATSWSAMNTVLEIYASLPSRPTAPAGFYTPRRYEAASLTGSSRLTPASYP